MTQTQNQHLATTHWSLATPAAATAEVQAAWGAYEKALDALRAHAPFTLVNELDSAVGNVTAPDQSARGGSAGAGDAPGARRHGG